MCLCVCMYMYIFSNLVFSLSVRISHNLRKRNWCEHPIQHTFVCMKALPMIHHK